MTTLKERLRKAMRNTTPETNQASMAKACGVSTAAVAGWFTKDSFAMQATHCFALARLMRVNAEWLATGRGRMVEDLGGDDSEETKQAHRAILDAYRRLPEQAKYPVRQLIESLTVAFDPTYHAYIEGVIEHNAKRDGKPAKERT